MKKKKNLLPGDEWMVAPEPVERPTRMQEQARLNWDYARGKISREQWLAGFEELSDVEVWGPEGKR
jgi:hypothetical protein